MGFRDGFLSLKEGIKSGLRSRSSSRPRQSVIDNPGTQIAQPTVPPTTSIPASILPKRHKNDPSSPAQQTTAQLSAAPDPGDSATGPASAPGPATAQNPNQNTQINPPPAIVLTIIPRPDNLQTQAATSLRSTTTKPGTPPSFGSQPARLSNKYILDHQISPLLVKPLLTSITDMSIYYDSKTS